MKLLGAAMIAASCGWLCAGKIRRERLALRLLGELVDALGSMEGTIRFQRLPLPQVIATQTGPRVLRNIFFGCATIHERRIRFTEILGGGVAEATQPRDGAYSSAHRMERR